MTLRLKTKDKLLKALKTFNVKDLFTYAIPEFAEVEMKEITDEIRRNRLDPSKSKIINLFMTLMGRKEISSEECERRIALLQTKAVALKPEKCQWVSLRVVGDPDMFGCTNSVIENLVLRSLRRNGIESVVQVFNHSSAYWIGIVTKKIIRKKLVLSSPVFFAFYVNQPIMFVSNNSTGLEQPVIEALGFVDYTKGKLRGRNVKSMLEILTTKYSRPELAKVVTFNEEPIKNAHGLDYSQAEHRKKYMRNIFSSDTPKLSDYAVECKDAPWHPHSSLPQMANSDYRMRLRFKTKDAVEMFRALAEEGLLEIPLPIYVKEVLRCARNSVRIGRAVEDLSTSYREKRNSSR